MKLNNIDIPIFNVIELSEGKILSVKSFTELTVAQDVFVDIARELSEPDESETFLRTCAGECYFSDNSGAEICIEQSVN